MSAADSQLMNYLVRMVVPMRREFGRSLDVRQFLHDVAYAREVIEQALQSRDTRLQEYAKFVQERLHGARPVGAPVKPVRTAADSTPDSALPPPAPRARSADTAPPATNASEQLRAQVLKKYTGGLR